LAFLINTLDIGHVFIGGTIEPFASFMPDMLRKEWLCFRSVVNR
jgi:hypothetical protein